MTGSEQREAARQFINRWRGKGKEDEDGRSYLYWTRRPSRSYAKAGMNRPAGVKTAHSCGHTSS